MPPCATVVDQLLSGSGKRDKLDATYWHNLVKSVAAVVYEGNISPLDISSSHL